MEPLDRLCINIGMPSDMRAWICEADIPLPEEECERILSLLTDPTRYMEGFSSLRKYSGVVILKVMLLAALNTHAAYCTRGIPDEIFYATMACFTRFVNEHKASYGTYGFDRGFWTGRQLSCLLYRVGTLEYEMVTYDGSPALSVHIPSDSLLTDENVSKSLSLADDFFSQYYPAYSHVPYICHSWLLSPTLFSLLTPTSNIARFASRFSVVRHDKETEAYKQWLYKKSDLAPEEFPEETSLQRAVKAYVLAGGKIGEGFGILKRK